MAEPRRPQVTITLGRSGQVVKRAGGDLDGSYTEPHPVSGSKRSVRERLGDGVDSSAQFNNKRLRGDGGNASARDGIHLSRNDLRHKIKQKNKLKQSQSSQHYGMDLRNILSRPAKSSINSIATRERMPEPKDKRQQYSEVMDARQHNITESRGSRPLMSMTRNSSPYIQEYVPQRVPDHRELQMGASREGGRRIPVLEDVRHSFPEPNSSSMMNHPSGLRPTNTVTKVESGFDPRSPWTLDSLRRRSPDDVLATSRGISAGVRDAESQRRLARRTYDDPKGSTYMSKDAFEFSRPTGSSPYLTKMVPPVGSMTTMAPVPPRPLPSSLTQRNPYVVNDHLTVESFLRTLGLEKYAIHFRVEEVDVYSLKRMTEFDLKEMGIPMGPRKKILLALQPYLKRPA